MRFNDKALARSAGDGGAGRHIRAFDWSGTALGPIESWPSDLRMAVDFVVSAPQPMILGWGPDAVSIYNDHAASILGSKHRSGLGLPCRELFTQALGELGPMVERALAGEAQLREDQPIRSSGGGEEGHRTFTLSVTPLKDMEGAVKGFILVATDITGKACNLESLRDPGNSPAVSDAAPRAPAGIRVGKETAERTSVAVERAWVESTLKNKEERFRALMSAGASSIYRISPDWRIRHRLDKETLTDVSGPDETWQETHILAEDRPLVSAGIEEAVRTRSPFELEHRVPLADGGIGWVLSRAVPLLGPDGEIAEWFAADSDVTSRRVATERLRETETRHRIELAEQIRERTAELKESRDLLQATMDSSMDTIQVFKAVRDESGGIVDFNWVLNNHTSEYHYGEVRGQSLLERNPGVVVEGIFDAFKRVTESGIPEQTERHYVHEQFDGWFYQSIVKLNDGVATTVKEISAWKKAQAEILDLREAAARAKVQELESRLRQFGEASTDILWIRDAETLRWTYLTPAFETIYGLSRDEALAGNNLRSWLDLILAEDRERVLSAIHRVRSGEHATFEYRIRRPMDGTIRWLRDTDFPIRSPEGHVESIGGIGQDITEIKLGQQRLAQSEERLRGAMEVGRLGLWDWSVRTDELHWSNEHFRMMGYAVGEIVPNYDLWKSRIHPDDRAGTEAELHRSMNDRDEYEREYRVVHPDGSVHWLYGRGRFFYDENGCPERMIGAMVETTERREWEEHQSVLIAELQHRTRNLIAVIGSIARQTMARTGPTEAFSAAFEDRLEALSRVQDLLSRAPDERVTIREVLEMELKALGAPLSGGPVEFNGPDVALRKSIVQTLAMAIHELATNARKYGALANGVGKLTLRWRTRQDEGEQRRLFLEWIEEGIEVRIENGQAITQGGGYGRQLIENALPYSLKARTTYEIGGNSLRCTIDLPLTRQGQGGSGSAIGVTLAASGPPLSRPEGCRQQPGETIRSV